ncbi:hypothetical protein DNFV4_03506 [Nitrospira tepida]|uniref:DUF5069 domain-containing protein n=1 Tax=Nitrospira tepida TaxID=2973512 RepID=A0AA86N1S4_9BACT|nr:DUF5069 domain-containing protein [Nitrospira tepida]CAI4033074.1 hypothetical protein DNFV4_03506 [Nitrospira tepida]
MRTTSRLFQTLSMDAPLYPRSPKVLLGGLAHLARLIDKIRLRHAGLIQDYHYLTTGFDKSLIELLSIDAQAFKQRVLAGGTDEDLLEWVRTCGRTLSEAETRLWTGKVLTAGPADEAARDRFQGRLRDVAVKRGVPLESLPPVSTWVEAIELDEGRL